MSEAIYSSDPNEESLSPENQSINFGFQQKLIEIQTVLEIVTFEQIINAYYIQHEKLKTETQVLIQQKLASIGDYLQIEKSVNRLTRSACVVM